MAKRIDPRVHNNFVDANFWDSSGDPKEVAAMRKIIGLAETEEVNLILPHTVKMEIEHPNTPREVKHLAAGMIYTLPTQLTPKELEIRAKILNLIQGNARAGKHDRDVCHIFEAVKHGGGYFITKDNRLLLRSKELESLLGSLRIVRPSTFMENYSSSQCDY